jgi:signal peptidase I
MAVVDEHGALLPGQFVGVYKIRRKLGQGGFGITYLAAMGGGERLFAIKEHFPREFAMREGTTVRPSSNAQTTFKWARKRFLDEARTLSAFDHPAINKVVDVIEANGTAYMVLKFEDAPRLGDWLDALNRKPSQAELDRIVEPLTDALDLVHGREFLHRDIAPDNILIRRDGTPCLIDFGAARHVMGQQTKTLTALIKPGYSPIEQYDTDDSSKQGPWTDIYAFAATLYRAIAGQRPPESTGRILNDKCTPLAAVGQTEYRANFVRAVDAGLAIWPDARPRSIADWRAWLLAPESATVVEQRIEPPPPPKVPPLPDSPEISSVEPPGQAKPATGSWRRRAVLGLGATAVLGGGVGIGWYFLPALSTDMMDDAMEPTIAKDARLSIARLSSLSGPRRGDIIAFRREGRALVEVSRVIGLPGDVIHLERDGKLVLNGVTTPQTLQGDHKLLQGGVARIFEQTLPNGLRYRFIQKSETGQLENFASYLTPMFTVPAGHYFVLNDNRDHRLDSRSPFVRYISTENLVGVVTAP